MATAPPLVGGAFQQGLGQHAVAPALDGRQTGGEQAAGVAVELAAVAVDDFLALGLFLGVAPARVQGQQAALVGGNGGEPLAGHRLGPLPGYVAGPHRQAVVDGQRQQGGVIRPGPARGKAPGVAQRFGAGFGALLGCLQGVLVLAVELFHDQGRPPAGLKHGCQQFPLAAVLFPVVVHFAEQHVGRTRQQGL